MYEFELQFLLARNDEPEQYLDALFEVGCDDAVFGIAQQGQLGAMFVREGSSLGEAISSAVRDVIKAVPGAKLMHVNH